MELLDEMIREGIDAILIKVAAIGLGPEHLGKTLKEVRTFFFFICCVCRCEIISRLSRTSGVCTSAAREASTRPSFEIVHSSRRLVVDVTVEVFRVEFASRTRRR